ncbi:UNVERIFIED_ORG: hypothetical protein J2W19_002654 [Shinella zoogloeoides]|nr:hypothetical protein [Shinella zoogloeoides]
MGRHFIEDRLQGDELLRFERTVVLGMPYHSVSLSIRGGSAPQLTRMVPASIATNATNLHLWTLESIPLVSGSARRATGGDHVQGA